MKGVTIYLGSKCNLNCAYCHRQAEKGEHGVTDEFLAFLKRQQFDRIRFIGGEPTLYFEDIRKVVAALPAADYSITTNGVGIGEFLPFFDAHRFLVCVSYDGAEVNRRGFDPFTHLLQYPWLGVSCTLYHGNTDMKAILRRFAEKEKIIGRPLSFFPHIAHVTAGKEPWFMLTHEDMDSILSQYKELLGGFVEDYVQRGIVNTRLLGLFRQLQMAVNRNYEFGETYCVNRELKKTDTDGSCLSCLYLRRLKYSWENWQEEQGRFIAAHFPGCRTCPVYSMCGAACIKSVRHADECYFYKNLYTWFRRTYEPHRELLDRLEGW